MADWYVSSAAYAAIPVWVGSHAYSIGDFVRPTAPAAGKEYAFRVTTAGTSTTEPTWPTANNATVTGGATFTNVTGQSTYGWSAPAGTLWSVSNSNTNRPVAGDRVFLSSDHSENLTTNLTYGFNNSGAGFGVIQIISVNRAGSVPPVAADITSGAAITATIGGLNTFVLEAYCPMFWQGVTINNAATTSTNFNLNSSSSKVHYFKDCALKMTTTNTCRLGSGTIGKVILDNTTVQFGSTGHYIGVNSSTTLELTWINTPSAIAGATLPTSLFNSTSGGISITCRGVDLSAVTNTLATGGGGLNKLLLDSCRIASGITRLSAGGAPNNSFPGDEVELVNCWDGTNVINERYTQAGAITTDRSTYLSGGAQDDVGNYSLKMVSSTRSDFVSFSLDCFAFDVENTATGSSKTATVEIISSGTLNNNDIRLMLEYMGTSGNPVASFGDTLATVLTSAAALSSSSSTWNSPPGTPQKQLLQVTFTPQRAGRVRGLVRLGKVSTTVWVNPQVTIT